MKKCKKSKFLKSCIPIANGVKELQNGVCDCKNMFFMRFWCFPPKKYKNYLRVRKDLWTRIFRKFERKWSKMPKKWSKTRFWQKRDLLSGLFFHTESPNFLFVFLNLHVHKNRLWVFFFSQKICNLFSGNFNTYWKKNRGFGRIPAQGFFENLGKIMKKCKNRNFEKVVYRSQMA